MDFTEQVMSEYILPDGIEEAHFEQVEEDFSFIGLGNYHYADQGKSFQSVLVSLS
jgi:hypothetical protein